MKNVLICGGAGYIGSHMSHWLQDQGHQVTVLDNLSTGHRGAVHWGEFIHADLLDPGALDQALKGRRFDAVIHFCARSLVGESVRQPNAYYRNNVTGTINLLEAMQRHDVQRIVFSSTAAIFGNPVADLIDEEHPKAPINPYGASKLMAERILADAAAAYGLRSVSLRYFNAAGALPDQGIGEAHLCETHLIPNVLKAALGDGPALRVFGDDYPTPDGTCVRDYVHVQDLAQAHALALGFMEANDGAHAFNLGNGRGFSVREVIATAAEVSGKPVPFEVAPRRDGDPATLVASSQRARDELGWVPEKNTLADMIGDAWAFYRSHVA